MAGAGPPAPQRAYVALGSNLGDRAEHLRAGRAALEALPDTTLVAESAVEETAPVKINLSRRTPLYCASMACVTYLDPVRYENDREYWQRRDIDAKYILEGIDTEAPLGNPRLLPDSCCA